MLREDAVRYCENSGCLAPAVWRYPNNQQDSLLRRCGCKKHGPEADPQDGSLKMPVESVLGGSYGNSR